MSAIDVFTYLASGAGWAGLGHALTVVVRSLR